MTVNDMNNDLDESLKLDKLKSVAKEIYSSAKDSLSNAKKVAIDEFYDNSHATKILIKKIGKKLKKFENHEDVTEEEFRQALNQIFIDNAKLLTVAGISVLPGSVVTLPLALKIANKLGINLIPSKTF